MLDHRLVAQPPDELGVGVWLDGGDAVFVGNLIRLAQQLSCGFNHERPPQACVSGIAIAAIPLSRFSTITIFVSSAPEILSTARPCRSPNVNIGASSKNGFETAGKSSRRVRAIVSP